MDQAMYRAASAAWEEVGFGDADWTHPIEATMSAFGGTGLILHALDRINTTRSEFLLISASITPDMTALYNEQYIRDDPRARYAPYARSGEIVTERSFARHPDEIDNTPIYADVYRRHNWGRCAAVRLDAMPTVAGVDASQVVMFNLLRANDADIPDDRMSFLMLEMALTIQRSLRTATALEVLRAANAEKKLALDLSPVGILFVRSSGLIIEANAAAHRHLVARDAVASMFGNLTVLNLESRAAFQRALSIACASGVAEVCAITRGGGRPLGVVIVPVSRASASPGGLNAPSRADAIVMLLAPESDLADSTHLWRAMYRLTRAEADIARLLIEGRSPRDIADHRGVAFETVRTQCKHIYGKLGVNSHAGAVACLMRSLLPPTA
jgi:DNA-binding CsgD family transcriptional regulator/PAS domain-containing protein